VQQGSDGFVLAAAVFQDDSCNGEEMGDVGDGGALAHLSGVQLCSVDKSLLEPFRGQPWLIA
jgi:hypothetical protein